MDLNKKRLKNLIFINISIKKTKKDTERKMYGFAFVGIFINDIPE